MKSASAAEYRCVRLAPQYQVFPIRKGGYYNFANTTYFHDGYAQFKSGASWVGWTEWGVTNRTDADLQFYFAP